MATKYTFNFTDTSKAPFDVQSYTSNGIKTPSSTILLDRASQAHTTLKLYGKGLPEYGEGVLQNMVYMLENYANGAKPEFSIEGQTWYKNGSGSELFIRNATGNGDTISTDWTAVILASGTSAMTGELTLSGTPVNPSSAIPLSVLTTHANDFDLHLTTDQNTFFDGLNVSGSPALTAADVNQLIGITGNVQTQLDNKLSLDGGTMSGLSPAANITFSGGEVLGLPALPSGDGASASKKYVDDQILSGAGGDGALTSVQWMAATGSPPIVVANTTARFIVTFPDTSTAFIETNGISREGHAHAASDITVDNSFDVTYPTNVQGDIELIASKISTLETAVANPTPTTVDISRAFEILTSTLTTGTVYSTISHAAADNKLSISINGVKQYNHTTAFQNIEYADAINTFTPATPTGLDESLNYDFNIIVDGGSPATLVTITAGTQISTHDELITAITIALSAGSPPLTDGVTFTLDGINYIETFTGKSTGAGSSISITDPGTADTYLFEVDSSPDTITAATFLSEAQAVTGSPQGSPVPNPDTIEIAGDVTASFPAGQAFAIRGSVDATYSTYDGIYSVHVNGSSFDGGVTTIPIAKVDDSSTNTPLIPIYDPTAGSPNPVPAPSPFGSVYITPIVGIDQIATGVDGIEGDYAETDVSGNDIQAGITTEYVVFNYDILSGSKIEVLRYS